MTTAEEELAKILHQVELNVEKPFVTAQFGDQWKEHAAKNYTKESVIDIAWKQGRKALLYERIIFDLIKNKF